MRKLTVTFTLTRERSEDLDAQVESRDYNPRGLSLDQYVKHVAHRRRPPGWTVEGAKVDDSGPAWTVDIDITLSTVVWSALEHQSERVRLNLVRGVSEKLVPAGWTVTEISA